MADGMELREKYSDYTLKRLYSEREKAVKEDDELMVEEIDEVLSDNYYVRNRPDYEDALKASNRKANKGRYGSREELLADYVRLRKEHDRAEDKADEDLPESPEYAEVKALLEDDEYAKEEFIKPKLEARAAAYEPMEEGRLEDIVSRGISNHSLDLGIGIDSTDREEMNQLHHTLYMMDREDEFDEYATSYLSGKNVEEVEIDEKVPTRVMGNPRGGSVERKQHERYMRENFG